MQTLRLRGVTPDFWWLDLNSCCLNWLKPCVISSLINVLLFHHIAQVFLDDAFGTSGETPDGFKNVWPF